MNTNNKDFDPSSTPPTHLMIPGPTPLPDDVRAALAEPAVGHRSGEFKKVLERVFPKLQWVFGTKNDVFLYTSSGTGAMEAAMVNTLNPGDKIVVMVCGVFSERWAEISETLGLDVERIKVEAGEANTVESLKSVLDADTAKTIKAVCLTHSETSTGVLNPVKQLLEVVNTHGALSIVDTVTSIGSAQYLHDAWQCDLAVSGSQKGFMCPPGLSFLAVSEKAWKAHEQVKNPGYYFNFTKNKKAQDQSNTAYTPSTALIKGLDVALSMMHSEGLEAIWQRHAKLQAMTRAGVEALGLTPLVSNPCEASLAVTSIKQPEGVSIDDLRAGLKDRFGIIVANGQKDLKGKIFRIGHLGYVTERDTLMTLSALEAVLRDLGFNVKASGVEAAMAVQSKVAAPV